jgi:putative tryptophan/tyrosine transport system substrate-binding protein
MKLPRRSFLHLVAGAAALPVMPRIATAQPMQALTSDASAGKTPVLGYMANENVSPERLAIFKKGLVELGYVEGKTITIEYRAGKLDSDYLRLVSELIERNVNIIVASNAPAATAASRATRTIPIVIAAVNDPVGLGLIKSLDRPGTNVTGTTNYAPHLIGERVRLLKALYPMAIKIAMFANGNNANVPAQLALFNTEAEALGMQALQLDVRTPPDIERAFAKAGEAGVQGLFQTVDSFINSQRAVLARLAAQNKLPMVFSDREYVLAGGLMSIGPGHQEGFEGAAGYVDKILRGANPADLPVARTKQVDFTVSRSALVKIGLTLPKNIADRVNDWAD